MKLSRVSCGFVAAIVSVVCLVTVIAAELQLLGRVIGWSLWMAFLGPAAAVFFVADWLGIMAQPYAPPQKSPFSARELDQRGRHPSGGTH